MCAGAPREPGLVDAGAAARAGPWAGPPAPGAGRRRAGQAGPRPWARDLAAIGRRPDADALALEIDPFARKPGVEFDYSAPADESSPFAALQKLRDRGA